MVKYCAGHQNTLTEILHGKNAVSDIRISWQKYSMIKYCAGYQNTVTET